MESVGAYEFFRTLKGFDRVLLVIGFVFCLANGLVYPSIGLVMGEVTGAYDPKNADKVDDIMLALLKNICLVGAFLWFSGYVYYALF